MANVLGEGLIKRVKLLIQSLMSLLAEQEEKLSASSKEIEQIKYNLEKLKYFILDAHDRERTDEDAHALLEQIKKVTYDTEDVLDEYLLSFSKPYGHGPVVLLLKAGRLIRQMKARHHMENQLATIKNWCETLDYRKYNCNMQEEERKDTSSMEQKLLSVKEPLEEGIETPVKELTGWLVQEEARVTVISVVGMAGLGKTTMARKIYGSERVRNHFQCFAWISLTQSPTVDHLLRSVMEQFYTSSYSELPLDIYSMKEDQILLKLKEYVKENRYLIVFDDVWGIYMWEFLSQRLPENENGSRVIVTTRSTEVAYGCVTTYKHVYNLQPLDWNAAWDLFCKKVTGDADPSSELPEKSKDLVEKCRGQPLAIVTLAGLLATMDRSSATWGRVSSRLGSQLQRNIMTKFLSLSFSELPSYLKPCFLYLALLPQNFTIRRGRLIRLWVAEGFAQAVPEKKTQEELAEHYLMELISRSLIVVVEKDNAGRIRTCRMHETVREMALSIAREDNFGTSSSSYSSQSSRSIRSLVIDGDCEHILESESLHYLRSLLLFSAHPFQDSSPRLLFRELRLLKVLDMEGVALDRLPNEVCNLFNLRYLSLRNTKISALPKSIGKLKNLRILDVRRSNIRELPNEILKIRDLSHLLAWLQQGLKVPHGIKVLSNLEKLSLIDGSSLHGNFSELGFLTQLRRLGISNIRQTDAENLCASLQKMTHLRSLHLISQEILDLRFPATPQLLSLQLSGPLKMLHVWVSQLQNLVKLSLSGSKLKTDPLQPLLLLPELLVLELAEEACEIQELKFNEGFKSLKHLKLCSLSKLHLVKVETGALPKLEELHIQKCNQLERIPEGIKWLDNLKELRLVYMPKEFLKRLQRDEGEDWEEVSNIPVIRSKFSVGGDVHESISSSY
ncbi:disease resistance protein RPM1-like [Aristolochia californica]|uniref:disease resistance protein RPM1-like n=1 Tax=Aristolochia californica TaxID=171875 RepID=UPI0035E3882B